MPIPISIVAVVFIIIIPAIVTPLLLIFILQHVLPDAHFSVKSILGTLKKSVWIFKAPFAAIASMGSLVIKSLKVKPKNLAPTLVWLVLAALLFKPLFGNPFSRNGWSAAFSEPTGFIVYATIAVVSLWLIVSASRTGKFKISNKWKRVALRSTIVLMIVGGIGYFLYFSLSDYYADSAAEENSGNISQKYRQSNNPPSREFTVENLGYKNPEFWLMPGEKAVIGETARNMMEIGSISGKWYETTLWGYKNGAAAGYFGGTRNSSHCYGGIPGVMGGETLIVFGVPCASQDARQFTDGEKTISVTNTSSEAISIAIYYHAATSPEPVPSHFNGSAKFLVKIANN